MEKYPGCLLCLGPVGCPAYTWSGQDILQCTWTPEISPDDGLYVLQWGNMGKNMPQLAHLFSWMSQLHKLLGSTKSSEERIYFSDFKSKSYKT